MANFVATYPYDLDYGTPGSYNDASQSNYYKASTTAVGSYPYANGYGLYDMHGNVFEWCSDNFADYPSGTTRDNPVVDPVQAGSYRVLRGGGWNNYALNCRSAYRHNTSPGGTHPFVGFRVAFVP